MHNHNPYYIRVQRGSTEGQYRGDTKGVNKGTEVYKLIQRGNEGYRGVHEGD